MSRAQFQALADLFERARDLTPSGRAPLLEAARTRDPELYGELVALLKQHDGESPFDAETPGQVNIRFPPGLLGPGEDVPEQIGPYRVIRKIGVVAPSHLRVRAESAV